MRAQKKWVMLLSVACLSLLLAAGGEGLMPAARARAQVQVQVEAADLSTRPEIAAFIDAMVVKHQFDRAALQAQFRQARMQASVVKLIARPATAAVGPSAWPDYRAQFVNVRRILSGALFWQQQADALARARQQYGVAEEFLVSIIGVETFYGERTGSHKVFDALVTLAFDYPPRAAFFRAELEQYLLLLQETGRSADSLKGSYAGAMGIPQFMPSSYRRYAVDFDGDRKADLWENPVDAIGSVANYLQAHGWQDGQPVAARAEVNAATNGQDYRALLAEGYKPARTLKELKQFGVSVRGTTAAPTPADINEQTPAALIEFTMPDGKEHWLVFNNFYAITRYNQSSFYAMSVVQLAEELKRLRGK